jgi:hypothetical protein
MPDVFCLIAICVKPGLHSALHAKMTALSDALMVANPGFRLELVRDDRPFELVPGGHVWSKPMLARNALIDRYLRPEHSHVLWIDADIVSYPSDVLTTLYAANPTGIAAPFVLIEGSNQFYDTAAYIWRDEAGALRKLDHLPPYWPTEHKPVWLSTFRFGGSTWGPWRVEEMEGVGCMYLTPAWPYHSGVRHLDDEYTDHWAICQAVRARDEWVLCLPELIAEHANLPLYGENWR